MEINLFGLKLGKKKPLQLETGETKNKSFAPPQADDDAVTIEASGGFFNQTIDLDGTTRTETELIYRYREMSMNQECASAIDDIITEAIVCEDNQYPVKINLDRVTMFSAATRKRIAAEFNEILRILRFNVKGYEIFRRWYIDSKIVYHIIVDEKNPKDGIKELRYVDPINIQKIRLYKKQKQTDGVIVITDVQDYYVYNKDGFKAGTAQGLKISPDAIIHVTSGLYDSRSRRTVGYLHKAIKPLNQLKMMEDAVVIYRLSRAPERRIFYVDVGSLPTNKAEQYLRNLMNRHRNKMTYDAVTGEMRDDRRFMSMLEDYWMPRKEGGKGTEITTLQGGQNLGKMEDVEYFQKNLYKALDVPYSRMDEQKSFSIGRSTEITRDEVKFSKFVARIRNKFSELLYEALKTQLILKNILTIEEWNDIRDLIKLDYVKDSYFAEMKQNELMNDRMNVLAGMTPHVGKYYSEDWIKKNILMQNEAEIDEMKQQMDQEQITKDQVYLERMQAGLPPLDPMQAPAPEVGFKDLNGPGSALSSSPGEGGGGPAPKPKEKPKL